MMLVQNQVRDQRHLVQQTVGERCPGQTSSGGLVGDIGQEDVQVVLKKFKVPRIFISKWLWQKVKKVGTMYPKGPFPCLFHPAGCITRDYLVRHVTLGNFPFKSI